MRAVVIERTGGPEVLTPAHLDDPNCGPDQVVVDVEASGVNYHDVYVRSGQYPKPLPYVPGIEGAGTVREVGTVTNGIAVGDRVAWVNEPGGYATRVTLPATRVVPIPPGLPAEVAAAALLQGMTAHYLTHDTFPVRPGDVALVHAAAGGMGLLLTQLITLRGGSVIGTASGPAKAELATAAGATCIVDYCATPDPADLAAAVRAHTGGRGVDVVYDGIGAPTFEASLDCLRPRGTLAAYGQAGGRPPPVDLFRLRDAGSVFLTRPDLNHHIASRAALLNRAAAVFELIAGPLQIRIGGRYPLVDASRAHADLQGRRTIGKLLLDTRQT